MKRMRGPGAMVVLAVALMSGAAAAQVPGDGMQRFAWLAGEWEGEGWMMMEDGVRHAFRQRESVRWVAGGRALFIEGTGSTPAPGSATVHEAVALLSHDPASGRYLFRAHRAEGPGLLGVDAAAVPTADGFTWGFAPEGGPPLRFTLRHTPDGAWEEWGEVQVAPGRWHRFLEMRLTRIP